jgi:hypothetical protein
MTLLVVVLGVIVAAMTEVVVELVGLVETTVRPQQQPQLCLLLRILSL